MSSENDELEYDLSAWDVPAPAADLADAVIARMDAGEQSTEPPAALPVEPRAPARRALVIASAAAACLIAGGGVYALVSSSRPAGPASGEVVADRARTLALDGIGADLDPGANVRWRRAGATLHVEQRAGAAAWRVGGDDKLVIDAGATVASVEATGASLRVEVKMNSMDARVIGASALTAAAVSLVTITVYSGHVRVTDATHHSVVVQPGASHSVAPLVTPDVIADQPVVGATLPQQPDTAVEADVQIEPGDSATIHATRLPVTVQVGTHADCQLGFETAGPNAQWLTGTIAVLDAGLRRYEVKCSGKPFAFGELVVVQDGGRRPLADGTLPTNYIDADGRSYRIAYAVSPPAIAVRAANGRALLVRDEHGAESVFNTPMIPAGALAPGTYTFGFARDALTSTLHVEPDRNAPVAYFTRPAPDWHGPTVRVEGSVVPGATVSTHDKRVDLGVVSARLYRKLAVTGGRFSTDLKPERDVISVRVAHPQLGVHYFVFKPLSLKVTHTTAPACDPESLKEQGMQSINMGEHATALGYFEQALACTPGDSYITQLAFMTACSARNAVKAKTFYTKLSPMQQSKFLQICIRNNVDPTGGPPCDAATHKQAGLDHAKAKQHARAVASLDASYQCVHDPALPPTIVAEACRANDEATAKAYLPRLSPKQQRDVQVGCILNGISLDLPPAADATTGFLVVSSKPQAKILIDGVDTGLTTPIVGKALPLAPGKHKVTFVIGQDRFTYPVKITSGKTATMSKDLQ